MLTVNKNPVVNAGPDQTITLPGAATLSGSATDDGIPNRPGALSYTWTKTNGPGTVTFADTHAANTTATFSVAGTYTLQLSASDSVLAGSDKVIVTVNPNPNPSADLKITVSDGKTDISAGQKNNYTIAVTNAGPNSVTGAVVTDVFPGTFSGVTFTAMQAGGATGFTANGSGNINDTVSMPVGSKITYAAAGTITSSATGSISNTATVTVPNGVSDPINANNIATDSDTISLKADLKVTITDGKTTAIAGQKDTYTIVVTNLGPSNVIGAVVSDSFPGIFTGVTFTATQSGGALGFTANGSGNISDTLAMPSGSNITYKATGTISPTASGTLSDTATVTAPNGSTDPNLANNTATDNDTL